MGNGYDDVPAQREVFSFTDGVRSLNLILVLLPLLRPGNMIKIAVGLAGEVGRILLVRVPRDLSHTLPESETSLRLNPACLSQDLVGLRRALDWDFLGNRLALSENDVPAILGASPLDRNKFTRWLHRIRLNYPQVALQVKPLIEALTLTAVMRELLPSVFLFPTYKRGIRRSETAKTCKTAAALRNNSEILRIDITRQPVQPALVSLSTLAAAYCQTGDQGSSPSLVFRSMASPNPEVFKIGIKTSRALVPWFRLDTPQLVWEDSPQPTPIEKQLMTLEPALPGISDLSYLIAMEELLPVLSTLCLPAGN